MKVERTVCITLENFILRATSALALCGHLVPTGTIIEVSRGEAENLKSRNRAVDATQAEVDAAVKIIASGTINNTTDLVQRLREISGEGRTANIKPHVAVGLRDAQIDALLERAQRTRNEGREA